MGDYVRSVKCRCLRHGARRVVVGRMQKLYRKRWFLWFDWVREIVAWVRRRELTWEDVAKERASQNKKGGAT
jgi:hypothetical protein